MKLHIRISDTLSIGWVPPSFNIPSRPNAGSIYLSRCEVDGLSRKQIAGFYVSGEELAELMRVVTEEQES